MQPYSRPENITAFVTLVLLLAAVATLTFDAHAWTACLMLLAVGLLGVAASIRRSDWAALLMRAIDSTPTGVCLFDTNLQLIVSNEQFAGIYGLAKADVKRGTPLPQIVDSRKAAYAAPDRIDEHVVEVSSQIGPVHTSAVVHELRDGRFVSVSRHPVTGGGLIEVHRDVTNERLAEDQVNQAMQALIEKQYAIDQAVIVAITDVSGTITYANDKFCKISGYSQQELIGQNHRILKSDLHPRQLFREMYRRLAKGDVWRGELCNRAKCGRLYWVDTVITPQLGPNGKPIAYMAIRVDITARKEAEAQVSFAATHDSLTGLWNRSALLDLGRSSLAASSPASKFSVHLIDLDGFKGVNDTLGHGAGDNLLKQVASLLTSVASSHDIVARLGGDEFAILRQLQDGAGESALRLGRRIVEAIGRPFELDGHSVNIGASVGIALCPDHGSSLDDLLKRADLALYEVKGSGRNNYRLYQPAMLRAAEEERALESKFRKALAAREFELHYQPILDVETRSVRAAEALVRWRHPVDGLISPAQFIPLAEHTGLILPLGEWIIQQACQDAASWPRDVQLAVNVSAIQFKHGNLFDVIMRALLLSGLSPQRLHIEVTETALLEEQLQQLQTFRQLKNMGITLVLDDFGTGFSSANYLTTFPFDKIKIDKSFVQRLDKRECAAVMASAVALARGLGMSITAEGIETESQFQDVRSLGIDFAQGYLFARPMPFDEFSAHVEERCVAASPGRRAGQKSGALGRS